MNCENILEWHSELDEDDDVGDGGGEDAGDGGLLNGEQTHAGDRAQALDLLQRLEPLLLNININIIVSIWLICRKPLEHWIQIVLPIRNQRQAKISLSIGWEGTEQHKC